ncbi:MAG: ABC transporter permease [Candidatus Brocadiae bacterium]|nr:ABC transporter permease [Candidatus Brocadiia bacterium]
MKRFAASVRTGFALTWKKETNWGSPASWIPWMLIRPVAGAMILWLMAGAAGNPAGFLAPAWFGNAAFQFVPIALGGMAMTVIEDRERYQMFKYIALSPSGVVPYLAGSALARSVFSALGVTVLVATGLFALNLELPQVRPLALALSGILGLVAVTSLGLAIAGIALHVARHGDLMAESIGGVFFLLSGAVFPIDLLPVWVRPLAFASPVTWWLESLRRSVGLSFNRVLSPVPDAAILGILAGFAVLCVVLAGVVWSLSLRRARWRGLLDTTTAG